jgi:hypothetical protein
MRGYVGELVWYIAVAVKLRLRLRLREMHGDL